MAVYFDGTGRAHLKTTGHLQNTHNSNNAALYGGTPGMFGFWVRCDALSGAFLGNTSTDINNNFFFQATANGDWTSYNTTKHYNSHHDITYGGFGADQQWRLLLLSATSSSRIEGYVCAKSGTASRVYHSYGDRIALSPYDPLTIGQAATVSGQASCAIADVFVIDQVLSTTQIESLAVGDSIDSIVTPIHWWKLTSANDLADYGSQPNSLTRTGTPTTVDGPFPTNTVNPDPIAVSAQAIYNAFATVTQRRRVTASARAASTSQAGVGYNARVAAQAAATTAADASAQSQARMGTTATANTVAYWTSVQLGIATSTAHAAQNVRAELQVGHRLTATAIAETATTATVYRYIDAAMAPQARATTALDTRLAYQAQLHAPAVAAAVSLIGGNRVKRLQAPADATSQAWGQAQTAAALSPQATAACQSQAQAHGASTLHAVGRARSWVRTGARYTVHIQPSAIASSDMRAVTRAATSLRATADAATMIEARAVRYFHCRAPAQAQLTTRAASVVSARAVMPARAGLHLRAARPFAQLAAAKITIRPALRGHVSVQSE